MNNKYTSGIIIAVLVIVAGFFIFESKFSQAYPNINTYDGDITLYKSLSCGCCELYSGYFEKKSNIKIKIVSPNNITLIKQQYEIPLKMESCHTTIIGDYFIEGHVPLEAVEKLLEEKPDIDGIALPGMPVGSPGMPGPKEGSFKIYAISNGAAYEFMIIS